MTRPEKPYTFKIGKQKYVEVSRETAQAMQRMESPVYYVTKVFIENTKNRIWPAKMSEDYLHAPYVDISLGYTDCRWFVEADK